MDHILTSVVVSDQEIFEDEERIEVSEYERARNVRVAQIQAEFDQKFPNFWKEMKEMKIAATVSKKRKKTVTFVTPVRKSSRLRSNCCIEGGETVPGSPDIRESELSEGGMSAGCCGDMVAETDEKVDDEAQVLAPQMETDAGTIEEDVTFGDIAGGEGTDFGVGGTDRLLGRFGCDPCEKAFRDSGNLKRHVLLVHGRRDQPLVCPRPWCDELFHVLAELNQHTKMCLKTCDGCGKTFNRRDKFEAHRRAHEAMNRRMV